ncbi:MAG: hypothetical protein HYT87_12295 [Nitrospirae bacterium]|nr:hypothetical protein [Nitrospirota bacterium]
MKHLVRNILVALLLATPACSRGSRRLPASHEALQGQIQELCTAALEHLDRNRMPMQKYLSPLDQGVNYVLIHKGELSLDEGTVEDLLDLRVSVEKDVNKIEAKIKTLSAQIRAAIEVDGLADADIEDPLQQIGELQAEIEHLKAKGLAKAMKELSDGQQKDLGKILLEELG